MYTTKLFNKKDTPFKPAPDSKEAKNQSTKKYQNDEYGLKPKVDSRHRGSQFVTQPGLKGMTTGYFGKVPADYGRSKNKVDHREAYKTNQLSYFSKKFDVYKSTPPMSLDAKRFRPKVAPNQCNFGSNDVHRSDEFCNGMRQQQYKELLSTETKFQSLWAAQSAKSRGIDSVDQLVSADELRQRKHTEENQERRARGLPEFFQSQVPDKLFDVGKTNDHPTCYKCKTDRFYCKHRVGNDIISQRRHGGSEYKLMSAEVGGRVWGVSSKPTHGRVSSIKQFNDISHL